MSADGIASGDGGDVNNNMNNEFDSSIGIEEQFNDAIEAENFVLLRSILAQKKGSCPAVTDADIYTALYHAASVDGVASVECCRLLWEALSPRSKKKYFAKKSFQSPLHAAVQMGHLELVRFFIQELKWNTKQQDYEDETPLYFACSYVWLSCVTQFINPQSLEIARFLLEK